MREPGRGLEVGVQADDRVEVDHAACLVLDDLHEPGADELAEADDGDASDAGQVAGQGGDEPLPHQGCAGVEDDRAVVVVALRAHRPAEPGIFGAVPHVARDVAAMRAGALARVTAGAAGLNLPVALAAGVDRAERGSGERGEHARVLGHRVRDALPANETGQDELAGIALVDLGAMRADFLAPVAAVDVQRIIDADGLGEARRGGDLELRPGLEDIRALAGSTVNRRDMTRQADGMGARARVRELAFPVLEMDRGGYVGGCCHRPRALWFGGDGGGRAAGVSHSWFLTSVRARSGG